MDREQFTFYLSFAKAVSRIKNMNARCRCYDAIVNYALYGAEPSLDDLPEAAAIAMEVIMPTLTASRRKAEARLRVEGKMKEDAKKIS